MNLLFLHGISSNAIIGRDYQARDLRGDAFVWIRFS